MKKKGTTFIEIVVAITIFLIAILPVTYLTLNSLRALKRASEIEEGARVTTTVINYIKSRGYDNITSTTFSTDSSDENFSSFSGSYYLSYDPGEGAYVVTDTDGTLTTNSGKDFETDFYGTQYNTSASADGLFFIESLGIDLNGAVIDVVIEKTDLHLAQETSPSGTYITLNHTNPITTSPSSVIIGSNGILEDSIIYGLVKVAYTSKAKPGEPTNEKHYEQTFVVTPLENFNE